MCGVNTMSYLRVWVGPTQYQSVTSWTMEFWVYLLTNGDIGTSYNPIMETKTQQLIVRMDFSLLTGIYYVGGPGTAAQTLSAQAPGRTSPSCSTAPPTTSTLTAPRTAS